MKKIKMFLYVLFLILIAGSFKEVSAASKFLISVGKGQYAITVNDDTTVDQIIAVLGQPKIETCSAFGGKAYTFYTDNNYSNYLYIETTASGDIISFGSVDETYKTSTYSYGDKYPFSENSQLYGCLFPDGAILKGGVYYNRNALYNGNVSSIKSLFEKNFKNNPTKYIRGLSEQAVTMYNALSLRLGNRSDLIFDEDIFYMNEQFKAFGTSIRQYLADMDKSTIYLRGLGSKENVDISKGSYYLLNPMQFASIARDNLNFTFDERKIAVFDYNYDEKRILAVTIRKDAFDSISEVDLTPEEQAKLSAGRVEFNEAERLLSLDSSFYDILPDASNASRLVSGKMKKNKLLGVTAYMNAIRTAAGEPKLEHNDEASDVAQHVSTLMTYRLQALGLQIEHNPSKPTGVTDDYYYAAMGYGKGYRENLGYSGNVEMSNNLAKYQINVLLDDNTEVPRIYGHRQCLLDSSIASFGYGASPYMFSTQVYGNKGPQVELEAWPAKGVTFLETLYSNKFAWTAQFVQNYKIQDNTTATIKCLNTGKKWEFTNSENTTNRVFSKSTDDAISSLSNRVVMYDSTIAPEAGNVYEVTLHNVKNASNGATTDYTYRSVFEYANVNNYPTRLKSISLEVTNSSAKRIVEADGRVVYYIPLDEEVKFNVKIDQSVTDKRITWVSSNDKIKVTQNGTVLATGEPGEEATIAATYTGTNVTSEVYVKTYKKLETVKLDKQETTVQVLKKESDGPSLSLSVVQVPDDATDIREVEWKVASYTNLDIEYDINDPEISKYIKVVVDPNNQREAKVYALGSETDNNRYKVIAKITGISGDYTGSCIINLGIPVDDIQIIPLSSDISISMDNLTIDYDKYIAKHPDGTFKLGANTYPVNATGSKTIVWSVDDPTIVESLGDGTFKVKKEGKTKIKAATSDGAASSTIDFNLSVQLKGLAPGTTQDVYITGNSLKDRIQLNPVRIPEYDTSNLYYESLNPNIASVTSPGGVVIFEGQTGTVTIRVSDTKNNPKFTANYVFNVHRKIDDIKFQKFATNVTLTKGEKYENPAYAVEDDSITGNITYSSSDTSVATVDNSGTVKAIKGGNTTIRATLDGAYTSTGKEIVKEYYVFVSVPLTDVKVPTKRTMVKNTEYTLNIEKEPLDATEQITIQCTSDQDDIISVKQIDSYGEKVILETHDKLGDAEITVIVTDGKGETYTKKMKVTVSDYLKGDLDKNGVVDPIDASKALDIYKYGDPTEEELAIGDMDENGIIDPIDASFILDVYKNPTSSRTISNSVLFKGDKNELNLWS